MTRSLARHAGHTSSKTGASAFAFRGAPSAATRARSLALAAFAVHQPSAGFAAVSTSSSSSSAPTLSAASRLSPARTVVVLPIDLMFTSWIDDDT
jgi:hypothetical protein